MPTPKSRQQLLIRDNSGVVIHLNGLAMVGNIIVSRVRGCTASISYISADNSIDAPELGVGSPESAQGEISGFKRAMSFCIQQW